MPVIGIKPSSPGTRCHAGSSPVYATIDIISISQAG